jgi:hypothetical protein
VYAHLLKVRGRAAIEPPLWPFTSEIARQSADYCLAF